MTAARRISLTLASLALAATMVALAGCTAGTAPDATPTGSDTQTDAHACAAVRAAVEDAATQVQRLDPNDPTSAVDAFAQIAGRLDDAGRTVGNRRVAQLIAPLQAGFATASADVSAIAGGDLSRLPSLQAATSDIQSALAAFASACPAS